MRGYDYPRDRSALPTVQDVLSPDVFPQEMHKRLRLDSRGKREDPPRTVVSLLGLTPLPPPGQAASRGAPPERVLTVLA